jgi:hypothetical protein
MHGRKGVIQVLIGKPEGKRPLGIPRYRWENIKMDYIHLVQCRDQGPGSCEHSNEPSGSIKCRKFLEWLSKYWVLKKDLTPGNQFYMGPKWHYTFNKL